jgi:Ni,Fe-hydrogenase III small subunit/ferredoxin
MQGYRTTSYPSVVPQLPDRLRGLPRLQGDGCPAHCRACVESCPVGAIQRSDSGSPIFDLGKCLFCVDCVEACPSSILSFDQTHQLASTTREHLLYRPGDEIPKIQELQRRMKSLFGRSLKLRQVSAGGCNACEADINVLSTIVFDIARFGIQVVAGPRHADGLLITGPVPENMRLALEKTWAATPSPKIAIALGSCAISGGPFAGHNEVHNGALGTIPIDLYIPGCPPHPLTILDGLLRLMGRLEK